MTKKYRILDYNSTILSYDLKRDLVGISKLDKNSKIEIPKFEVIVDDGYYTSKGLPCAVLDKVNLNNTVFTSELLDNIIDFNRKNDFFQKQKMISALDHPKGEELPQFKNGEVSHAITNLYYKDINDLRILFCDIIIYDSSDGKNLLAYLLAHANLGLSIRGLIYDYVEKDGYKVFTDYEILGIDIVTSPSNITFLNMDFHADNLNKGMFGNKDGYDTNSISVDNLIKTKESLIRELKKYI